MKILFNYQLFCIKNYLLIINILFYNNSGESNRNVSNPSSDQSYLQRVSDASYMMGKSLLLNVSGGSIMTNNQNDLNRSSTRNTYGQRYYNIN